MLLPGTRFTSLVTLYLSCLLAIELARKVSVFTNRFLKKSHSSVQVSRLVPLFLTITIMNIIFYANMTNENFLNLKNAIPALSATEANGELIFLNVQSQGWREYRSSSIFVDEYPFWGNLEEYMARNKFRDAIIQSTLSDQLSSNEIKKLKREFRVHASVQLVTTKANISHLRNIKCIYHDVYYWCDLDTNQ
jgi:hypothetical protein